VAWWSCRGGTGGLLRPSRCPTQFGSIGVVPKTGSDFASDWLLTVSLGRGIGKI
jgi:hypothetical protein